MAVSGAWTYTLDGTDATITDYDTGIGGFTPTIPTTLDGNDVIAVGDYAMDNKSLTSLTLDNAVDLGDECFANNSGISVTLNADITTARVGAIGNPPFEGCALAGNLTITSNVTTIPNYLFGNCGLTSVSFPSSVTSVGKYSFWTNSLTALTIPSTLTVIDDYAFSTNSISSLTLDNAVDLGDECFANNSGISVTLDADITTTRVGSIGTPPFEGCALSGNLTITSNVTTIPNFLFGNCGLTSVSFPSSVTSVGNYVLSDNDNLTSIIFKAQETITFGSNVLTNSEPSPKGTIYGYDASVETWAAGFSAYYDFSYDVPVSSSYITNFSGSMYNYSKFSKVIEFLS